MTLSLCSRASERGTSLPSAPHPSQLRAHFRLWDLHLTPLTTPLILDTIDVLSLIEIVTSIIAVCLPSFRLVLRRYRDSIARNSSAEQQRRSNSASSSTASSMKGHGVITETRTVAGLTPLVTNLQAMKRPVSAYDIPSPMSDFETPSR